MSVVYEKAESFDASVATKGSTVSNSLIVLGEYNELGAISAAQSYAAEGYVFSFGGVPVFLVRGTVKAKEIGNGIWECSVDYKEEDSEDSKKRPDGDNLSEVVKWSYDTTGTTQKLTVAKKEIARGSYSQTTPAPDMYGAIGWDGEQLQGADIVIPSLKLSCIVPYKPSVITQKWIADLARNTGKTNSKKWQEFEPGELLYTGSTGTKEVPLASGRPRTKPQEVTHNFECSENVKPYKVGNIEIPEGKKGWEYAWVRFRQMDDPNTIVYPRAVHAYIDQVYDEFDFKKLFGF